MAVVLPPVTVSGGGSQDVISHSNAGRFARYLKSLSYMAVRALLGGTSGLFSTPFMKETSDVQVTTCIGNRNYRRAFGRLRQERQHQDTPRYDNAARRHAVDASGSDDRPNCEHRHARRASDSSTGNADRSGNAVGTRYSNDYASSGPDHPSDRPVSQRA